MRKIENVVIAGAGLMGASISQVFAQFGFHTVIYSNQESDFDRARQIIRNCQATLVENEMLTAGQSEAVMNSLGYDADPECFRDADYVIEAIPEDIRIKSEFYRLISGILPEDAVVSSNTSAISINALSKSVKNPGRFCGTHWLNPPHIIPLVEITGSDATSPEVVDTLVGLLTDIGKQPVVLKKDVKGFLSNRLQFALLREASYLVESGVATPEDIDRTLKFGNGIRYACSGPFKIVDLGGIAVFNTVARYLYPDLSRESEYCRLLDEKVQAGQNGISTGGGFYTYTREAAYGAEKERDKQMLQILKSQPKDNA